MKFEKPMINLSFFNKENITTNGSMPTPDPTAFEEATTFALNSVGNDDNKVISVTF